jgi:hypothetical protein
MTKKAKATIGELFNWYAGEDWKEDWQTTNTMSIDGNHAQDESEDGLEALEFLAQHENEEVEISGIEESHAWDLDFTLMGKLFTIQSTDFYGEGVEI